MDNHTGPGAGGEGAGTEEPRDADGFTAAEREDFHKWQKDWTQKSGFQKLKSIAFSVMMVAGAVVVAVFAVSV